MAKKKTRIYYSPAQTREMSLTAIRKAYRELRPIAKKRVERLIKAGYGDTDLVKTQLELPPIRGTGIGELGEALAEVSYFLRNVKSQVSKIKAIERKTKKTLERHGYTVKDLKKFGDFMEYARSAIISKAYDSYRMAMLQYFAEKHNISPESFRRNLDYFYNNLEVLAAMVPIERKDGAPVTASNLIQKMERAKWQEAGAAYIEQHGEIWRS